MSDAVNKNLRVCTDGEWLWLWRHAEGLTGHDAAARLGMGRNAYWKAERPSTEKFEGLPERIRPSLPLLLRLARRRAGLGLPGTAKAYGVTHPTLLSLEKSGALELFRWWEKKGFTFV